MTVIDGIHRLRAAELRGWSSISVRFFDGSAEDGRLLAVALNVAAGLPLSVEERTAAAERILAAHPEWSDRSVASVAGLSSRKTADIRRGLLGDAPELVAKRVGRDGRARPVDPSQGRKLAATLLRKNPTASLRQIAREAGISPATVADVRGRIARGEDVTVARQSARRAGGSRCGGARAAERSLVGAGAGTASVRRAQLPDPADIFNLLRRDPSLRLNETGRLVLRLLDAGAAVARDPEGIAASLPSHCKEAVGRLAQIYAQSWQLFAAELQGPTGRRPPAQATVVLKQVS
ncbi:ParB/RepB/Spo0J family partition protein [Streptomyces yunnanensis]|uniref:ParB/RepB/Spo0J family partition protein n=2 Tax=Streptomyces yunnanensis TaxID=156453 RepID=A0ABY8AAW9_9ACTN|nr:ParB/RepB/Spo0J family partition protein [Streptomyces yunnanensis]